MEIVYLDTNPLKLSGNLIVCRPTTCFNIQ
jgi:hypothetical protein